MNGDATETAIGSGRILPPDTVVSDRYRIVRLLGVGGMGVVYLAHDGELDIQVALKVLRSDGSVSQDRLERFRSEILLARQISHRNVVRIHDIGQSEDLQYVTMDFVEGRSLKQILEQDGPLPPERAVRIAIDLADAVGEAQHAGIVHRDIKPANVLIGDERAFLTDFGVARSMQTEGPTRAGEIVGTLDYLSPEQALGKEVDGRADIYALGLLLFEMLEGRRPFTGETAEEVLAQRTLSRPRRVVARAGGISSRLAAIIECCLAVDPGDRYRLAGDFAADLRADGGRPRRARRRWRVAAAVALVGVAAIAWQFRTHLFFRPPPAPRSVAVLPFDVASANSEFGNVSLALSELLGERLATHPAITVVAAQRIRSTLEDLRLPPELPESDRVLLGDLLDADFLVSGALQRLGDDLRMDVRLWRAEGAEPLTRAALDVDAGTAIFDRVDDLAVSILGALNLTSASPTDRAGDVSADAYRRYAAGVDLLATGNPLAAIEPLAAAVRQVPGFALAWDRLAEAQAAAGRDHEALESARTAVAALGQRSDRAARLVRARRAALAGEPNEAARELESLLAANPRDNRVRFMLGETYGESGRLRDALETLKRVVAASPDHPQAWFLMGKYSILAGDASRAADDYLVKALVIQNRLDNAQGRADTLNALGIAAAELGNADQATAYYRQALELREDIGDERGVAVAQANLARIDLEQGRYAEARAGLLAARDRLTNIGDRWTAANLDNELGYLEEQRGRLRDALAHYRDALRLRDGLGDRRAMAESYNNIGYTYYLLGEYDNAAVFIDRSLGVYREIDNREGIMFASQTRGILDIARGRFGEALAALLESLELSRELGDRQATAVLTGYVGKARHLQGHYGAAAGSYAEAVDNLEALGDSRGTAEFSLLDASLALDLGMWDVAKARIDAAQALLAADDNAARRSLGMRLQGERLLAAGYRADALENFRAALDAARDSGDPTATLYARLAAARHGDTSADVLGELREVFAGASRIGHRALRLDAALALARVSLDAGRPADAEPVLESVMPATAVAYHGSVRLHALLAESREMLGRDAGGAWRDAFRALAAAFDTQNDDQRAAFRRLPVVVRVLAKQEEDVGD